MQHRINKRMRSFGLAVAGCMLCFLLFPNAAFAEYVQSLIPERNEQEIREKWNQWMKDDGTVGPMFTETPSTQSPYSVGKVSDHYLQQGLNATNFYRFISGLPGDLVLDPELNKLAQYGAVTVSTAGHLTHSPQQPADMAQDFYEKGAKSASRSNLYYSTGLDGNILVNSVLSYMDDSDASNIDRLGHRRWILNPKLQKIGFGLADQNNKEKTRLVTYSAMQVFDQSRSIVGDYNYTLFPNKGAFPIEAFDGRQAWSVQLNPDRFQAPNLSDVRVEMVRVSDQKTWNFTKESRKADFPKGYRNVDVNDVEWHQQAYFNVDTGRYGNSYAIIFRPDHVELLNDGDTFKVNITGLKKKDGTPAEISYQTNFFKIHPNQQKQLEGLDIKNNKIKMAVGEEVQLPTIIAEYEGWLRFPVTSNLKITTDSDLVTIHNGKVKGIKPGKTTLTISYGGKQVQLVVEVSAISSLTDIHTHWARDTIQWAVNQRIANGYKDGTFKPNNEVTEAEFLSMLFKLLSDSSVVQHLEEEDRKHEGGGTWSDKYYRFSYSLNLDVKASLQDPKLRNRTITRAQVAQIVAGLSGRNFTNDNDAIQYLLNMGYSTGKTSATVEGYAGHEKLSRAEAIVFLKNLKEQGIAIWPRPNKPSELTENEKNGGFPDRTIRAAYDENKQLIVKGNFSVTANRMFKIEIQEPEHEGDFSQIHTVTSDSLGNFQLIVDNVDAKALNIYVNAHDNTSYAIMGVYPNGTVLSSFNSYGNE